MNRVQRLGLGSAQFGAHYGITNDVGQPTEERVCSIVARAEEAQLSFVDTAPQYGESEARLGRCLSERSPLQVMTKTVVHSDTCPPTEKNWSDTFARSLQNLKRSPVYALVVHHANDLLSKTGPALYNWMKDMREKGMVTKIGVSVYTAEEIDKVLARYAVDIIQIPINILDQRLLETRHLAELKRRNIEIVARSIFLQGLLLAPVQRLPNWTAPFKKTLDRFQAVIQERGLTPMQAAFHFVFQLPELDRILIGVNTVDELNEILRVVDSLPTNTLDWSTVASHELALLNPTYWPKSVS